MHKILLSNPRIGSYSVFLLFGLLSGYLLARWRAQRLGIKGAHIDNLTLLIALFSLFGARLFSWLFYFPSGTSFWRALRDPGGGMVFYGGMIFGFLTLLAYARFARLSTANLLDIFAPGLALGLALGRVGCFMAGCCWGDLCVERTALSQLPRSTTPWQVQTLPLISPSLFPLAVRFPPNAGAFEQHRKLGLIGPAAATSLPVHPVQLYEAFLALLLCICLHRYFRRRRWQGEIFYFVILCYAMIRFATEFLRADNAPVYLGLTLSQVISICLAVPAALALAWKATPAFQRVEIENAISET